MVNVGVLFTDILHRALKTPWKMLRLGLKLKPPSVGLALAMLLHRLPVVVDDQVGNVDTVNGQLVESVK